jgi:lysophospholipase L1-like esterase
MFPYLDSYTSAYWSSPNIKNETLMFVEDKDGTVPPAPLMYSNLSDVKVTSYDQSVEFVNGVDFKLVDGNIFILPNSRIPVWKYHEFFLEKPVENASFPCLEDGYQVYGEGDTFVKTQVCVSYTHTDEWDRFIPPKQEDRLSGFRNRLRKQEPVNIVFYGDSITAGCNVSSLPSVNLYPYMPRWDTLVCEKLKQIYGYSDIIGINTAVGGKTVEWGLENLKDRVISHRPHLAVIAFGMNDPEKTVDEYKGFVEKMVSQLSGTDVILVSPMIPNMQLKWFAGNQIHFEQALDNISQQREWIAVAPVTSVNRAIFERKRFIDTTANNVNHPNDFLARVYAQTLLHILS